MPSVPVWFAIPGDPDQLTGGYLYDRRLTRELGPAGIDILPLRLHAAFPYPSVEVLAATAAQLARLPDGATVLVDGLAFGAMPQIARTEARRLRLVALVHHPLGHETGLAPDVARALVHSERCSLACARAVIVTSAAIGRSLVAAFGLAPGDITVAAPGTDRRPLSIGSSGPDPLLLAVGSVIPRKGFEALIEALAQSADLPWRLSLAGSLDRHPACVAALRMAIGSHRLADRVTLAGELAPVTLAELYRRADLFVSAATLEGYGMALAEAVASGLPIVAVAIAGGAVADWLDPEAALIVPPGDPAALAAALREAVADPARRAALARGATIARDRLPEWRQTAATVAQVLCRVAAR